MDLEVSPALRIPAGELVWRFSRSPGPGGQHVNTSDSRVELMWDVRSSRVLTDAQRHRLLSKLRLINGVVTVAASEQRSQLRNRELALEKLAARIVDALAPDAPTRRPTKPTRGSARRHAAAKSRRSETKQLRRRPRDE